MRQIPDLPSWAWLIVALVGAIALVLPFWMLWKIPVYRRLARAAKQRGPLMYISFWVLFIGSYLLIAWSIIWLYWHNP